MKNRKQRKFYAALGLLAAFILWTAAVRLIDVRPIGPQDTSVGFAALNRDIHSRTGVHMSLYTITDWLGLVPLSFMSGFALLGLVQWIRRKSLLKVDRSILVLGGFYLAVMTVYLFFEGFVINYRPVLINGLLEASYPSSTTILTLSVMTTAVMQLNARIKNRMISRCTTFLMTAFTLFMVAARLLSGVHWFTDIVGGILLSTGLAMLYDYFAA